jgi:hypothetical protein
MPSRADDSAAAIAAGGLIPRHETRIVMAKETLQISPTKVIVDYDFRNDTDQDVTTEVAFPIPPYTENWAEQDVKAQSFTSFHLWINGAPATFRTEARAVLNGRDVTALLKADKIDIATFGHLEEQAPLMPDVDRLPKQEQERLEKLGLVTLGDPDEANWKVHLQYHWTQTFPAHSTVHIRHEYSPAIGFQPIQWAAFQKALAAGHNTKPSPRADDETEYDTQTLRSFCPDPSFLRGAIHSIQKQPADSGYYVSSSWVDFILTSANTWKQPIQDFTLIIERGKPVDGYGKPIPGVRRVISFCAPEHAAVTRLDSDRFQVHLTNFVPRAELHIGFFDFDASSSGKKPQPAKK